MNTNASLCQEKMKFFVVFIALKQTHDMLRIDYALGYYI